MIRFPETWRPVGAAASAVGTTLGVIATHPISAARDRARRPFVSPRVAVCITFLVSRRIYWAVDDRPNVLRVERWCPSAASEPLVRSIGCRSHAGPCLGANRPAAHDRQIEVLKLR